VTEQQTHGSRAVLFGVHSFTYLPALDGVRRNIPALLTQLTDPEVGGLPQENCIVVCPDSGQGPFLDAVCQAAEDADDLLLVYYAGHGHFGWGDDLLLATKDSSTKRRHRSVPYEAIREYVEMSRARRKVVIVDCCYSGKALRMGEALTGEGDPLAIEGACVLTSAAETQRSLCLAEGSVFTLALIEVLQNGLRGELPDGRRGHEQPHLITADVFAAVRARLAERIVHDLPVPAPRIATRDDGHKISLARNRAFTGPAAEPVNTAPIDLSRRPVPDPLARVIDQHALVQGFAGYRKSLTSDYLPFISPGPSHLSEPHGLFCRLRDVDDRGVLLVGAAGTGKTRTGLEVGWIALREGWRVYHASASQGSSLTIRFTGTVLAENSPVLIVIHDLDEYFADGESNGAPLDLTALQHLLLPEARRRNIQVALLASARPGWLHQADHLHLQLQDLFDEVELRQDDDFQRSIADHALATTAPTLVARLGIERSREMVGHRPIIAVLMARELEQQAIQGLPIPEMTRPRTASTLWSWARGHLEGDDIPVGGPEKAAFDEVSADWLVPAAAAAAACPQEKADVIAAASAALAHTADRAPRSASVVKTLIDFGWLQYETDSGHLNTVHDLVCDQLVESVLLSEHGPTANRESTRALLAGCLTSARTVGRYTTALARIMNDLASDNRATALSVVLDEWFTDHAQALGDVIRRDAHTGGYALDTLCAGPPFAHATVSNWHEVAGPWLAEFADDANAHSVLRHGLSNLPAADAGPLVAVALRWIETHGWRREASHVLGPLLVQTDLTTTARELVSHKAMGWLRRNGELLEAGFVLCQLLARPEPDQSRMRQAVAFAFRWLDNHAVTAEAHFTLRALLEHPGLTEQEIRRAVGYADRWLQRHPDAAEATYLTTVLDGRLDLTGNASGPRPSASPATR
jgi:hypothetical protein